AWRGRADPDVPTPVRASSGWQRSSPCIRDKPPCDRLCRSGSSLFRPTSLPCGRKACPSSGQPPVACSPTRFHPRLRGKFGFCLPHLPRTMKTAAKREDTLWPEIRDSFSWFGDSNARNELNLRTSVHPKHGFLIVYLGLGMDF